MASPVNSPRPSLIPFGGRALRPPFFLWVCLVFGFARAESLTRFDFSGPGMATTFRIACYAENAAIAEKATDACFQRIAELNALFTDYDPTSELMRLCAQDAVYPKVVSAPLYDILQRARQLAEQTQGAFDPTCGHLSQLWRRAKRQHKLPPADRLQKALAATDWRRITLHPESQSITLKAGTLLDLGGIAKGYAADECQRLLKQHGITRAVVQAGGDTSVSDAPPGQQAWPITLRTDAQHETQITLTNHAVSTSGDLYQFTELEGKRFSHIISPRTGLGLTTPVACSVLAPDCTTSDALATAMCVLGKAEGEKLATGMKGVEIRFSP
jgi:FAD:protein FMN transferase